MCCGLSVIAASARVQFSGRISLVEVYATVTDGYGQPLRGLTADDFEVEEDGVRQTISAFAPGDVPLALAVGIDRSFSIKPPDLRQAGRAVGSLLQSLHPYDQAMLIAFGSQTEIIAPLSTRALISIARRVSSD